MSTDDDNGGQDGSAPNIQSIGPSNQAGGETAVVFGIVQEPASGSFESVAIRERPDGRERAHYRVVTGGYLCDGTMPADGSMPAVPPSTVTFYHGPASTTFGVRFCNLPVINVRKEFEQHWALLHDAEFQAALGEMRQVIQLPSLTWRGLPHNVLTYLLQRAILGVEACVSAAVDYELHAEPPIVGTGAELLSGGSQPAVPRLPITLPDGGSNNPAV